MIVAILLLLATFLLSYANGANDNFKGVATLYGSGTTSFRTALVWANGTTLAGALFAVFVGFGLAKAFGGQGLVPNEVARSSVFLVSVGLAAAATVLLATRIGMPISTTHALMGSLAGAGLIAAPAAFQFSVLGAKFLLPLLLGPPLAFAITFVVYPALSATRLRMGITRTSCACAPTARDMVLARSGLAALPAPQPLVTVGTVAECQERYEGRVIGVSAQGLLNVMHFASAGAVGFARGLNDAPKIAALAFTAAVLPYNQTILLASLAMLLGGMLGTRRIAETMGRGITAMNDGQGCTANVVTASLVTLGSLAALPLSTTHVSCGALFGLGAVTRAGRTRMIVQILGSWLATLPVAAVLAALFYTLLSQWLA